MTRVLCAAVAFTLVACANNECKLDDPSSCASGLVCEPISGQDKPQCFPPVQVEGRVFDLASTASVAGANVTATDENGASVGEVATTDADGGYTLRIPVTRTDDKGAFTGPKVLLRAQAQDYQPFPSGLRAAIPIDTGAAAQSKAGEPWVVTGDPADIGLDPLPPDQHGRASISGTVDLDAGQTALVVAELAGSEPNPSAVADSTGKFTLFNVAPGSYTLRAYAKGANYTPVTTDVASTNVTGVHLVRSTTTTATVSGTVQIVSAGGGSATSVILVPASTFIANLARGEAVSGLRAPDPGTAPNITGAFSISGVPDGKYAVLAAFENDGLVRDPGPTAGTDIQFVTVTNGMPSTLNAFKVTSAVNVISPGGTDAVDVVSATPTLSWTAYPSAASYDIDVFDTLGVSQWSATNVVVIGGTNPSTTYAGAALQSGKLYQWRITAKDSRGNRISLSEDLKGVFRVQ